MKSTFAHSIALCGAILASSACAATPQAFAPKEAKDFKKLESFKNVAAFEASFAGYVRQCLNESGGGGASAGCFVASDLWDRELNEAYRKLMAKLDKPQQALLKKSQRIWLESRDSSIALSAALLDHHFDEPGTMWAGSRAESADAVMASMVKQRTLLLLEWLDLMSQPPVSRM